MALTCEPQALFDLAGCFPCLDSGQHQTLQSYLLCQILAELTGSPCDLEALVAESRCFQCLTGGQHQAVQTYLLCQIAGAV